MRKNGFTLIELLAVIVILAIIALIATPTILGIINDVRKESQERSVELYASAVINGIAAYQLREKKEVAAGTYTSETLPFDVEYDGDVICDTIDMYEDGGVYVADCKVNDILVEYTYGTKQEEAGSLSAVCDPENVAIEGTYTMGDEYSCEVKEGAFYTFYVLSTTETSVNLIMDSNVRSDGTPVQDTTNLGLVRYNSTGGASGTGPTTAIEYLNNATSSWTNIPNLNETYDDEGGHFTSFTLTGKARMPYLSEVGATGCDTTKKYITGTCPLWMVDYLSAYASSYPDRKEVSGVYGYWTLSSDASDQAWFVHYYGYANNVDVGSVGSGGVRPVITLSI